MRSSPIGLFSRIYTPINIYPPVSFYYIRPCLVLFRLMFWQEARCAPGAPRRALARKLLTRNFGPRHRGPRFGSRVSQMTRVYIHNVSFSYMSVMSGGRKRSLRLRSASRFLAPDTKYREKYSKYNKIYISNNENINLSLFLIMYQIS